MRHVVGDRLRLPALQKLFGEFDQHPAVDDAAPLLGDVHALDRLEYLRLGVADLLAAGGDVFVDSIPERLLADLGRLQSARLFEFPLAPLDPPLGHGAVVEGAGFPVDKLPVAYQYDLRGIGDGAVLAATLIDGSHYDLPSSTTTLS